VPSCMVVAEVGQAHDGSLGTAHAYVDAVAGAGADAVKFQTHLADAESTVDEPWRVRFSRQDATRLDYWRRMEFTEPQWLELREHAHDVGLEFHSSPFSLEAVDLLIRVGVDRWKIASGEVGNRDLLQAIARDGRPVVVSSGMSDLTEVAAAVALLRDAGSDVTVLQCTTAYPCPPERLGLNLLAEYREQLGVPVGLSDHTGTVAAGIAAAALGATLIETHVTLSREAFGPDVSSSLTMSELAELVRGVRLVTISLEHPMPIDKASEAAPMRALFTRSVALRRDLPAGHVLSADDLTLKKPGSGLPADELPALVGRVLLCDVTADRLLRAEDLAAHGGDGGAA
jgi:N,N'-diacetyllegionaminate synthase